MKENEDVIKELLWDDIKEVVDFEIVGIPEDDKDSDDEDDIKINEKKRKKWIRISKIKDYLMMIFLLLCSSVNFSILYIPCIILGISYIFLLLKFNNHMYQVKKKIEIISLVYSSLLIISKSVVLGLIQNDLIKYDFFSFIFNNLGIRHKNENQEVSDTMFSIIGEIFLLIISIISVIISSLCKEIDFEINNNIPNIDVLNKKIKTIIYFGYISILINAIYNKSYLTIFYLISYQFSLILFILKIQSYNFFRKISIVYLILFTTQLLLINIFNVYYLQEKLLKVNVIKDGENVIKVYSIYTQIGINYSFYHSILTFLYEWLSYVACVLTIVLFTINQRLFIEKFKVKKNDHDILLANADENEKEENKGCSYKIKSALLKFFTNQEFILFFFRILSLIWIYTMRTFFSLGIFTFLFFSFVLDDINKIEYLVIFLLIPIDFLTIGCLHVSNINGNAEYLNQNVKRMELLNDFAYEKDDTNIKYIIAGVYFLIIAIFLESFHKVKDIKYRDSNSIIRNFKKDDLISDDKNKPLLNNDVDNSKIEENILINEEIDLEKSNRNKEKSDSIHLSDVLQKSIYDNVDKFTLVVMYIISMHTINIIHFFNIVIFMIQILKINFTKKHSKLIVILVQILFLFEYIVDLTKNYYEQAFLDNYKLFEFLLSVTNENETYKINIDIEILSYFAIYAFYFQHKLLTSERYIELKKNKNISITNYINFKMKNAKKLKKIGFIISSIAIEIYIIGMFCAFFLFCCNVEINILISVKLAIFMLVLGGYFQKTQTFFENINVALKLNYLLIGYCCLSSFIVYGYQLLCLDFFGMYDEIKDSENIIIKNLPSFGLINYENKNLLSKLLPHFLSNFLSILMFNVMNFIYTRIDKKKDVKIKEMDVILVGETQNDESKNNENDLDNNQINQNKNDNIIDKEAEQKTENKEEKSENIIENDEDKKIIKKEKIEEEDIFDLDNIPKIKEDANIDNKDLFEEKIYSNIEEKEEKYKLINLKMQKQINYLNAIYFIFLIINFILKLYSPLMMLFFCYIFTFYTMSFSMIIYFLIISCNYIIMFKNIIKSMRCTKYNNKFLFTQLFVYKGVESKNHKKLHNKYDYKTYKLIIYFTLLFLFLSYLYSILYVFQFNNCEENENISNNNCNLERAKYGNYIQSIAYIFGMYNYSDISELCNSNYIYLQILILIIVSKYIKMIIYNIDIITTKNREKYYILNKQVPYLKTIIAYTKKLKKQGDKDMEKKLEKLIVDYEKIKKKKEKEKNNLLANDVLFRINFENIFKKSSKNVSLLSTSSMKTKLIIFLRVFKKIYEHFIIFAFICCIIIKINIWSIVYMIIIILLLLKRKDIKKFYYVFIVLVISTLIQTLILISNMNKIAMPKINDKILVILYDTFSIPFYQKYLGEKYIQNGVLLGAGINRSQLLLIWSENVLLFLIYIYLYYFSFSIFNVKKEEAQKNTINKKVSNSDQEVIKEDIRSENTNDNKSSKQNQKNKTENIIFKLLNDFKEDFSKMTENEYKKIFDIMKNNFNEEIAPFQDIQEALEKQKDQEIKRKESNKNWRKNNNKISVESKENKFMFNVSNYILFMFLHNIILIIVLLISMMCPGLLSAIVICFCLYFLYFAHLINKAKKSYYPYITQRVLRIIIIFDISFQLLIQIISIYAPSIIKKNNISTYIIETIGFRELLNEQYEITNYIYYLLGKSFCFFCLTFQKIIYSSQSFKLFYLSYIIKVKIYSFKLNSIINARIYNNERIKAMNNSIEIKMNIEKSMEELKEEIKIWSKNLENNSFKINSLSDIKEIDENKNNIINIKDDFNINNKEEKTDEIFEIPNVKIINQKQQNDKYELILKTRINSDNDIVPEKIVKKKIKEWILSQTFLIKIYLLINERAFCLRFSSYINKDNNMIANLIKGNNEHTPNIMEKINIQIDKLILSKFKKDDVKTLNDFLKHLDKMKDQKLEKYLESLNSKEEKDKNSKVKDEIEEALNDKKFIQLLELKKSILFKKYITKWYLIKKIIIDLITIISNNFCWICYFFMILNHMVNASIISIFYPLSIFCYALLENPRPTKHYWRLCYIYTFIILIIKCFFQKLFLGRFLDYQSEGTDKSETAYEEVKTFLEHYPIGIKLYDDYNNYFTNLFLDFLLLIILIVNRNILMLNGLWEHIEDYFEDIEKANLRVIKYKNPKNDNLKNKDLSRLTMINTIIKIPNRKMDLSKKVNMKQKSKGYYEKLFPKIRNEKPGKDFYYLYALAMILIIFYVLIFFTTMVKDKTYGDVNISTKQFSGMSIIFVLIHMIILIIDRIIYLRQNRYQINYEYILIDKNEKIYSKEESMAIIGKKFKDYKDNTQLLPYKELEKLKEEYNVSIFQDEPFNTPLFEKYILHIILTLCSHGLIFFYITMTGNYNIYNAVYCIKDNHTNECNDFQENIATIFFYILYLFYLTFSSLQIKYGFYDLKRTSIFKNVNSIHGLLFEVYKIIPFYYPIKNVIDWTVTPTSFGIFDWFKFENIYDAIFKTYRLKYDLNETPIGQKIADWFKIAVGGVTSIILVLILIVPLILFSSLNPTSENNNVNSAGMKIYMSFMDNNEQERNILIFENNYARSITNMTDDVWNNYYSKSYYTKTFPREQTQIISFYSTPENSLSSFKLEHIKSSIESLINKTEIVKCELKIETDFIRSKPSDARTVKKQKDLLICDYKTDENSDGCKGLKNLWEKLNSTQNNTVNFNISGFSPIVRLGASAEPITVELEEELTLPLIFDAKQKNLFDIYFEKIKADNGIQYHVLNEKISSGTFGYNVIGFYSAFILVIGAYVTNFFNYDPSSINIGEMPHPKKLLRLCEGIKVSRYLHDFKNEEYYFNFLIEILRTPDLIKQLTTSTLKQFNERKELPG